MEGNSLPQPQEHMSRMADYSANVNTKPKEQLEDVSNEMFYLEREIADLNRQYKELLSKSKESTNSSTLTNLRIDLNNIARLLEEKSERLFELKRQQQLALKSS